VKYTNQGSSIKKKEMNQIKIWWMASRPRALTISLITVGVGTLLARGMKGEVNWAIALFAWLFATFIQVGTHFINDALDFKKGVDSEERFGFPKVTQLGMVSPHYMLMGGFICLAIALLLGVPLAFQGGWPLILILLVCVANGYLYTGGPYPLSYSGFGDLFAFLFFGLVGTLTVYYLQTGYIDFPSVLAGTQVGLLATVMTALNNLRDIITDGQAGKWTLAVRFGKQFARIEITVLLLLPFLLGLSWIYFGYPFSAVLPFLCLPLANQVIRSIWVTEPSAVYNRFFMWCISLQVGFSLLLVLGFLIS
jgi:1,4-dihydroxy-2-naphthoate octaprenyltransferase